MIEQAHEATDFFHFQASAGSSWSHAAYEILSISRNHSVLCVHLYHYIKRVNEEHSRLVLILETYIKMLSGLMSLEVDYNMSIYVH